jgi:hypothetical protein
MRWSSRGVIAACDAVCKLGATSDHRKRSSWLRLRLGMGDGGHKRTRLGGARGTYDSKLNNRVVGRRAWNREDYSWVGKGVCVESPVNDRVGKDTFFGRKPDDTSWRYLADVSR